MSSLQAPPFAHRPHFKVDAPAVLQRVTCNIRQPRVSPSFSVIVGNQQTQGGFPSYSFELVSHGLVAEAVGCERPPWRCSCPTAAGTRAMGVMGVGAPRCYPVAPSPLGAGPSSQHKTIRRPDQKATWRRVTTQTVGTFELRVRGTQANSTTHTHTHAHNHNHNHNHATTHTCAQTYTNALTRERTNMHTNTYKQTNTKHTRAWTHTKHTSIHTTQAKKRRGNTKKNTGFSPLRPAGGHRGGTGGWR